MYQIFVFFSSKYFMKRLNFVLNVDVMSIMKFTIVCICVCTYTYLLHKIFLDKFQKLSRQLS